MYKNILVPVSFDQNYAHLDPVPVARTLAGEGAKITLLHVLEEIPAYAMTYMPDGFRDESRDATKAALDEKATAIPGALSVVIDGHAGRTILDYAEEHGVDLIVMASHHPGLGDYLLGSTAARVVRHAQCAVHVMR